jgi:uncharacterized protein (TIGR02453 family)
MTQKGHFSRKTLAFLRELRENNDREWFAANKSRYEEEVRQPATRFILDFAPYLKSISPHFKADPRASGGSLFRIHRDVRFSKDKSPYKTHTGIQFRHDQGKDAHAPGFYLHVEPGNSFVGIGIWRPDSATLRKIRKGLVEDVEGWQRVVGSKDFQEQFHLSGESLSRPPKGFDPNHPLVQDLKRKDFIALSPVTERALTRADFLEAFEDRCRAGRPLVAFLCKVLEVPF